MVAESSLLVRLVKLVDKILMVDEPSKRRRGKPKTYSDRLIVKALVVMIIRRLYSASALLAFLAQEDGVS